MAAKKPKSWNEKLRNANGLPKVVRLTGDMKKKMGCNKLLVPAPLDVDRIMKRVPHGKLITISEIRGKLASEHGAEATCPITTGIFAWIAANAADEAANSGATSFTPYWRTLKSGGEINAKYPGGVERVRSLLEGEGHRIVQKGKRFLVVDFEQSLVGGSGRRSVARSGNQPRKTRKN